MTLFIPIMYHITKKKFLGDTTAFIFCFKKYIEFKVVMRYLIGLGKRFHLKNIDKDSGYWSRGEGFESPSKMDAQWVRIVFEWKTQSV